MATVMLAVVTHALWLSASCGALAVVNPDGLDAVIAPWLGRRMLAGAVVLVTDRDGPVIHEAAGFADIAAGLKRAVREKPARGKSCTVRGVWQIGG